MIKNQATKRSKGVVLTEEELAEKRIQLDLLLDIQIKEAKEKESLQKVLEGIQTQIDISRGELNALSSSYLIKQESIKHCDEELKKIKKEISDEIEKNNAVVVKLNKDFERTKSSISESIKSLTIERNAIEEALEELTVKRKNKLNEIRYDEDKHITVLEDLEKSETERKRMNAELENIKKLHVIFKNETDQINTRQIEKQSLYNEIVDLKNEIEENTATLNGYIIACTNASNSLASLHGKIKEVEDRESNVSLRETFYAEKKQELSSVVKQLAIMFDTPEAFKVLSKFM